MTKPTAETEKALSNTEILGSLDVHARRRLIGAVIWFAVLIIWVPTWYEHPVNFQPEKQTSTKLTPSKTENKPIADKVYRLPAPSVQQAAKSSEPVKPAVQPQPSVKATEKQKPTQPVVQAKTVEITEKPVAASKASPKAVADTSQLIAEDLMVAKGWFVRLAAFKKMATANELLGALQEAGYDGYVKPLQKNHFFVVVIGPYPSKQAALKVKQKVDARYHVQSQIFHR
ncbi:SPOR domain-containing protein [Galenea microaerophila]